MISRKVVPKGTSIKPCEPHGRKSKGLGAAGFSGAFGCVIFHTHLHGYGTVARFLRY